MSITSVDAFTSTVVTKKQIKKLMSTRKKQKKRPEFSYGIANPPVRKLVRKK